MYIYNYIPGFLSQQCHVKGIVSKFWNFLYYWSDLTEIFTQYVKLKNKHFLFMKIFPFRAWFFIYIQIYINTVINTFTVFSSYYKYTYIYKRIELPQFLC